MSEARLNRTAGVAGLSYIGLMLIAWIVFWQTNVFTTFGQTPDSDASAREIAAFYSAHRNTQLTAGTVWALALCPLVIFLGRLHSALRAAEGGQAAGSSVFLIGAVGFIASPIVWVSGVFGTSFRAGDTDPAITQYNADLFLLPVASASAVWAAMFGAIAFVILRTDRRHAFPRWLGRFAAVTGALQFLYLGSVYDPSGIWWSSNQGILVAFGAYGSQLGWIAATSAWWLRTSRSDRSAQQAYARSAADKSKEG